ncbi:hypothetical protein QK263_02470, partial [Treponema pallidum]
AVIAEGERFLAQQRRVYAQEIAQVTQLVSRAEDAIAQLGVSSRVIQQKRAEAERLLEAAARKALGEVTKRAADELQNKARDAFRSFF